MKVFILALSLMLAACEFRKVESSPIHTKVVPFTWEIEQEKIELSKTFGVENSDLIMVGALPMAKIPEVLSLTLQANTCEAKAWIHNRDQVSLDCSVLGDAIELRGLKMAFAEGVDDIHRVQLSTDEGKIDFGVRTLPKKLEFRVHGYAGGIRTLGSSNEFGHIGSLELLASKHGALTFQTKTKIPAVLRRRFMNYSVTHHDLAIDQKPCALLQAAVETIEDSAIEVNLISESQDLQKSWPVAFSSPFQKLETKAVGSSNILVFSDDPTIQKYRMGAAIKEQPRVERKEIYCTPVPGVVPTGPVALNGDFKVGREELDPVLVFTTAETYVSSPDGDAVRMKIEAVTLELPLGHSI